MKRKMLYVENEDLLRVAMSRVMSREFDVVLAENGAEAVELLQTRDDFDVIVSDIDMPVMNGIDLFIWLQGNKPELAKRFVFVSGSMDSQVRALIKATQVRFLSKPVGLAELQAAVNEVSANA